MALKERVVGVLLGLAAGDQIGGPIRMALTVAESLCHCAAFDPQEIGERYLRWFRDGAFDTGPTAERVFALGVSGVSFEEASLRVDEESRGMTAGCNPAHRSAPLAMFSAIEDSRLAWAAITEAALTHRNPLAGDVAAAVVVLCRALIRGIDWSTARALASAGRMAETRSAMEVQAPDSLSQAGFAPEALRAAIHFVDISESFADALQRSKSFAGAANYCPVLVGSIAGARWGASKINESLLVRHRSLLPRLLSVATDLAKGWNDAQTSI
jgi:ADP-ribosylglycohydrolase